MFGSIGTALKAAFAALADWRRREIARAELEALDDRTLADIGLTRGEIGFAVAGRLRRETVLGTVATPAAANANAAARWAA